MEILNSKIGALISKNTSLNHLSLRNMDIDDDFGYELAYGLQINTYLTKVNLSMNNITCLSAIDIAKARNPKLKGRSKLKELNLQKNNIG